MSTRDPFEDALAAAATADRGDDLIALLTEALGIEVQDHDEDKPLTDGDPIALNDDAALARIVGGNLNTKENA